MHEAKNLKLAFMTLGNRLVTEHGYNPTGGRYWCKDTSPFLQVLQAFTLELNADPTARAILAEMGYEWPVVEQEEDR